MAGRSLEERPPGCVSPGPSRGRHTPRRTLTSQRCGRCRTSRSSQGARLSPLRRKGQGQGERQERLCRKDPPTGAVMSQEGGSQLEAPGRHQGGGGTPQPLFPRLSSRCRPLTTPSGQRGQGRPLQLSRGHGASRRGTSSGRCQRCPRHIVSATPQTAEPAWFPPQQE